jgi:hypothetical protein
MMSLKIFVVTFIATVIAVSAAAVEPVSSDSVARKEESVAAVADEVPVIRDSENTVRSYGYDHGYDNGYGHGYGYGHRYGPGYGHGYGHGRGHGYYYGKGKGKKNKGYYYWQ